jgi:uncharacterized protein (TIGR02147 family)
MDIDIYRYDDYRAFCADAYRAKKASRPKYTYRRFAAEAGFSNPGFLNDVIKGRRKLSADATEKMIAAFGLAENEAHYFRILVEYVQTKNEERRRELYRNILSRRNRSKFTRLHPSLSKYYQDYRYSLVRCAVEVIDFRGDYDALASFFNPPLPATQVKKIVRELCEWNLIEQGTDGRYRVTSELVEPPETLKSQIREINAEWMRQAYAALRRIPPEQRNISSIIFAVSDKTYAHINEKIEKLRDEIFTLIREDSTPQKVAQLSIQLFPKSRGASQ